MVLDENRAAYRILSERGFYGPDDTLYREGEIIYYDDEPNEEMEPLNAPAQKAMQAFLAKLDACGKKVADKLGIEFQGRPRNLDGQIAIAGQLERSVQTKVGGPGVPLIGAKNKRASKIAKADTGEVQQTGGGEKKREGKVTRAAA